MRNFELYVGGERLELDDKFNFALMFESSVFQDISQVKANRTSTIKIPKTIENLKAIEFSNTPEVTTEFPYRTKTVELYKNGIPIIQNGKGYIITISDYIEFAIIWGVNVDVKQLQELKLRNLPGNDYIIFDDSQNFIFRPDYRYGFAASLWRDLQSNWYSFTRHLNIHPFVSVKWIIEKISEQSGINIAIPAAIQDIYGQLCVPLLGTNLNPNIGFSSIARFNFINKFQINTITDATPPLISNNEIIIKEDCEISIVGTIEYLHEYSNDGQKTKLSIFKNNGLEFVKSFIFPANFSEIVLEQGEVIIDCKENDVITFTLEVTRIGSLRPFTNPQMVTTTGYFSLLVREQSGINFGDDYPIIPNLPDITAFDIIKTMMAMLGLFGNYSKSGIELYSIDDFYSKKSQAIDWTDKVITGSKINSIAFSFGDYAKQNWLKYKEDETVLTNADSYLRVDNDILETERTIYEMKFAPTDNTKYSISNHSGVVFEGIAAYFPYYSYDEIEGKLNINKLKDRIVMVIDDDNEVQPYAVFSASLFFQQLISEYYQGYQKIILNPKVIEVTVLLTDLEIYQLDLMTPVYLEQTGNYYIILDLQVNRNNTAKAKLIQM